MTAGGSPAGSRQHQPVTTGGFARARNSLRRAVIYVIATGIGHVVWETAQLPLYTIWWSGTARENLVAVLHCTAGDVLITTTTLLIAALIGRFRGWYPFGSRMAFTAIAFGVAYTILSEWLNVAGWRSWSYSSMMPLLPWLGTGLSPVVQWLVAPSFAFAVTMRVRRDRQEQRPEARRTPTT